MPDRNDSDARFERIERTIEILFQFQKSHEANLNQLFELQAKNEQAQAKNEQMLAQVIESINQLARIAHAHEQRSSDLEDQK